MEYNHLRAFFAVAGCGGFSAAARQIRRSQPVLSDQVKQLETRYGVLLFERSSRGVHLTPDGQELYAMAEQFFREGERIDSFLTDIDSLSQGEVTVASDSPWLSCRFLQIGARKYPKLKINIIRGNAARVVDVINQNIAELGICAGEHEDEHLSRRLLLRVPLMVVVPKSRAFAGRQAFTLSEFCESSVVMREDGSNTRNIIERMARKHNLPFDPVQILDGPDSICTAVSMGLGISCLEANEMMHDKRVRGIPLVDDAGRQIDTAEYLIWNTKRETYRLHRALIEIGGDLGDE